MIRKIDKTKLNEVKALLDINVNDEALLIKSLIHRSFVNESDISENNERLEYLGDAVLELIITEYLFKKFPKRPEGELTSFRAALVRTDSLAESAQLLGLGQYIYMSKGEEATGGRNRPYILANTFEAILGFMYIDQGYEITKKFVDKHLIYKLEGIVKDRLDIDSKSKLQELSQEKLKVTPSYELVSETGPDHEKIFVLNAMIGEHNFGQGEGNNKQEAAQNAAKNALSNWDEKISEYFS